MTEPESAIVDNTSLVVPTTSPGASTRPAPRRRSDLDPRHRAISDALDELNSHMHGLHSSWAYPEEFLTWLEEHGHTVTAITEQPAIPQAAAEGGELVVQLMTSWAPYSPELVADMVGAPADDIRRRYGDTVLVRMGPNGPLELRRGGPGPDPADVEETRRIVRDTLNNTQERRTP